MDGRDVPNDGDLVELIPQWIEDAAAQRQILVEIREAVRISAGTVRTPYTIPVI